MGFNWESGSWGNTPLWLVDCYLIIDQTIAQYQQDERDIQKREQERQSNIVDYTKR